MNCADLEPLLVHRALLEASPADEASLEEHLAGCPRCRSEEGKVMDFVARLRASPIPGGTRAFEERLLRSGREGLGPWRLLFARGREVLARSRAARIAAALLLLHLVGIPVLAALLYIRESRGGPLRIGFEPTPAPFPKAPQEPRRPFTPAPPGAAGVESPGERLDLSERLRGLRLRRSAALAREGRALLLVERGGGAWVEEHLARALARLRVEPAAFGDPARAPFVFLALLWSEARPGSGRDARMLSDLAQRLSPLANAGDPRATFALWEGFLAGAVGPEAALAGAEILRPPSTPLDAALAARCLRECSEAEAIENPTGVDPEALADSVRRAGGVLAWFALGKEGSGGAIGDWRPSDLSLEDAFAARGAFETDPVGPRGFVEVFERAAREGLLGSFPPERAALLLEAFLAPRP